MDDSKMIKEKKDNMWVSHSFAVENRKADRKAVCVRKGWIMGAYSQWWARGG